MCLCVSKRYIRNSKAIECSKLLFLLTGFTGCPSISFVNLRRYHNLDILKKYSKGMWMKIISNLMKIFYKTDLTLNIFKIHIKMFRFYI